MKEETKTLISGLGIHMYFAFFALTCLIPLLLAYFLLFQLIIKPINYLLGVIRKWR